MATSGSHGEFRPAGPTHDQSYEPDQFSVKPILAVPVVVIVTAAIAYVTTWLLFANIFDPRITPEPDNKVAAERNAAPLNERFMRISSTDPNAEVQQPRLEGLQVTEVIPSPGGQYKITAEITSTQPKKEGNSPRVHATDLRPEKTPELQSSEKDRLPIDQAISRLVGGGLLKTRAGAPILDPTAPWDRPKESNGGTGKMPAPAPAAPAEKPKE